MRDLQPAIFFPARYSNTYLSLGIYIFALKEVASSGSTNDPGRIKNN
jgi:hypothetical protein